MHGTLKNYGSAPYQHNEKNDKSFFIELQNGENTHTSWSLGYKDAIEAADVKIGDFVQFTFKGKNSVVLKNGKKAHRSLFSVKEVTSEDISSMDDEFTSDLDDEFSSDLGMLTPRRQRNASSGIGNVITSILFAIVFLTWLSHAIN